MLEWIEKQDPNMLCLEEIHFKYKNVYRLKINEWREIHHINTNQKKLGVAILFSGRRDFRTRKVIRNNRGHYIMIKGSVLQGNITVLNIWSIKICETKMDRT